MSEGITTTVVPTYVSTTTDTRGSDLVVAAQNLTTEAVAGEITTASLTAPILTNSSELAHSTVVVATDIVTTTTAQQGEPGIDGANAGAYTFSATNKQGSSIAAGSPCATHSSGVGAVLASASNDTRVAVGLTIGDAADQSAIRVQTSGPFTLSDWTQSTGAATLVAKGRYWLDIVAGMLTTTPPASVGNIVQLIGVAVSADTLDIQIWSFVKL